jgi:hypothetical protein
MVTILPVSSPFRAFLAFGDEFGDDFQGFRHHFVTSASKHLKKLENAGSTHHRPLFAGQKNGGKHQHLPPHVN